MYMRTPRVDFSLSYYHKVELTFNDPLIGWEAVIHPIVGGISLNVDFDMDSGLFEFEVMYSEVEHWNDRRIINKWILEDCDQFILNGKTYLSIEEVSLAMWLVEIGVAANDDDEVDCILECVGKFANDIQVELYLNDKG